MIRRIVVVFLLLFTFYILIIARFFYWQVIRYDDLHSIASAQGSDSILLPSIRGEIYASDDFPIATNKISYALYANPKIIKDKEKDLYAFKLSKILGQDEASLSAELNRDLYWIRLGSKLDSNKRSEIESLNLAGVGFQEESLRVYPESSMSAQLLGFAGRDEDGGQKGYFGLEGYYNSQLSGRDGRLYTLSDALGNTILNDVREEKKIDGRSLHTGIDRTIQYISEKELLSGIEKYQAEAGNVIVMDPTNGKIISMASFPRFDPQKYYDADATFYNNPVISDLYEPGSTFKVLVMAGAIDSGAVKPESRCPICAGPIQIGEYKIKTWNEKYYPDSTMIEVIQHSDNIGMVYVGRELGEERLLTYLHQFGIGELTEIDLQGEINGKLKDISELYPIDFATIAFGQGISITPIQLITAVSAIANGGDLVVPYVVESISTSEGKNIKTQSRKKRKVISSKTSIIMKEMMVEAVEMGESKWVSLSNYKIAGKTGTAQIPVEGRYDPDNTIASFVGFFPADEPKIIILVTMTRPKTRIYGSETAAPVFFSIARQIIQYLNIPPDR